MAIDKASERSLWSYLAEALKVLLAVIGTWAASQLNSLNTHIGELNKQVGILVERMTNTQEEMKEQKARSADLEHRVRDLEVLTAPPRPDRK
jgi:chromosome segregation ATPase